MAVSIFCHSAAQKTCLPKNPILLIINSQRSRTSCTEMSLS